MTNPSQAAQEDLMRANAARYAALRDGKTWPAVFASSDAPEPLRGADLDAAVDAVAPALLRSQQPVSAPPATIEDNSQSWAGMDGATAWHLIDRHADGWNDVSKMMHEWRDANTQQPVSGGEREAIEWLTQAAAGGWQDANGEDLAGPFRALLARLSAPQAVGWISEATKQRLFTFLNDLGGEGISIGDIDAGDLFFEIFPDGELGAPPTQQGDGL